VNIGCEESQSDVLNTYPRGPRPRCWKQRGMNMGVSEKCENGCEESQFYVFEDLVLVAKGCAQGCNKRNSKRVNLTLTC